MAPFLKVFPAEVDRRIQWIKGTASYKRSVEWMKSWTISSKRLDDSGACSCIWLRDSFQLSGEGGWCRKLMDFSHNLVTRQKCSQRWGCKLVVRDLVAEAFESRKFVRVVRGLIVSACIVSATQGKLYHVKAGLATIVILFLQIPRSSCESTDNGNIRSLTADSVDDLESDDKNSDEESDESTGLLDSVDTTDLLSPDGTINSSSVDTTASGSIATIEPSWDDKDTSADSEYLGSTSKQLGSGSEHSGSESQPNLSSEGVQVSGSDAILKFTWFPSKILEYIFGYLPFKRVFPLKIVSKVAKTLAEGDEFHASPSRKKPSLTSCFFYSADGVWKWAGYDAYAREWKELPPLSFLPADCKPDPDLFKEFLVCAKEGLVCINFSKQGGTERLIVFNPLSQVWKELPPLNCRRNPVLMHLLVDPGTMAYQVIVAGSSKPGDEKLSQVTEVFDSCTGTWTKTGDIPGPPYAVNEFQSGVHQNRKILCIGFVEVNGKVGKGIIAYDVKAAKWSSTWMHPLPEFYMSSIILQLVENKNEVYLFSERETGESTIEHRIDRVEWRFGPSEEDETRCECELVNVIQTKNTGGKSLELYPEHVLVPYGDGQLCIMNAIAHTGVVYDVRGQQRTEYSLEAPVEDALKGELSLFTLNPMSFTMERSFCSEVKPALQ